MGTKRARLRYEFDNFMTKGGKSFFVMLIVLFLGGLVLVGLLRILVLLIWPELGGGGAPFLRHIWTIFLQMTDPGNMSQDIGSSPVVKITAIIAGMVGVIIFSMLIAFITTELGTILDELKKGRSRVIESGHTLILGWNERVIKILQELIVANESNFYAGVVILADQDKEMMDDTIKEAITDTKTTRIVTRHGSTSTLSDLDLVNASKAKSAIVLASCSDAASREERRISDLRVIKTILALTQCQDENGEIPIVADVFSETHRKLVHLFSSDNVLSVDASEILGKILVQTSRSSGLAVVYNEMLSFDGGELYFYGAEWNNIKFYDALFHFPDGVPLGIKKADGKLILRPEDNDIILEKGDEILIFAEDDSTIQFYDEPVVRPKELTPTSKRLIRKIERQLFLGWHSIAPVLIQEFAHYLLEGSSIDVVIKEPSQEIKSMVEKAQQEHGSLKINLISRDPLSMEDLMSLSPFEYDNVIILSTSEGESATEKIDSETIMILLLLRSIRGQTDHVDHIDEKQTSIITQIMNSDNDELMTRTTVDDFIISNNLVSMMFAALSEEPDLKAVYDDIFSEEGSEIYIKPAWLYFDSLPAKVIFADIIGVAHRRGEICFGVRRARYANDPSRNFGVKLNPDKKASYTITEDDWLVVLAEDES